MNSYDDFRKCNKGSSITRFEWASAPGLRKITGATLLTLTFHVRG